MSAKYKFEPDYAIHPGETLRGKLEELEMTPKEFAVRTGKPVKTISEILNGKSSVTPEMAVQFEKVLGISAGFWIRHQADYNEVIAREKQKMIIEEAREWAKKFPYAAMAKHDLVMATRKPDEKVEQLLNFFRISKASSWDDIYLHQQLPVFMRISLKHTKDPYALSAWLMMGEKEAEKIPTSEYSAKELRKVLPELKRIMAAQPAGYLRKIQIASAKAGVKIVYTPTLPKTVINGAVRWIGTHPTIQMTDRYKRYDIFWFSLFHEVGHILLHGNKKNIFIENSGNINRKDETEIQADNFAVKWTLSEDKYLDIVSAIGKNDDLMRTVEFYARKFGTHQDIIYGRILHHNKELYQIGLLQNKITKIDFNEYKKD